MKKSNNQYFWQRRWFKISAAIVAVPLVLGLAFFAWYQFRDNQVETKLIAAADSLDIPGSWEVIGQDFNGSIQCLDACKVLNREYLVKDLQAKEAIKNFEAILIKNDYIILEKDLICEEEDKKPGDRRLKCGIVAEKPGFDLFLSVNNKIDAQRILDIEVGIVYAP